MNIRPKKILESVTTARLRRDLHNPKIPRFVKVNVYAELLRRKHALAR